MRAAVIVYGNHGESPVPLDDHLAYLSSALRYAGVQPLLSHQPRQGYLNLLIEGFVGSDVARIESLARRPDTTFVCIATEFLTGLTFNRFPRGPRGAAVASISDGLRQSPASARLLDAASQVGHYGRTVISRAVRRWGHGHYTNGWYWRNRYVHFARVADLAGQIWCIDPVQSQAYRAAWADKVRVLPVAACEEAVANPWQGSMAKDIDCLFTGTLTPYRKGIVAALGAGGLEVTVGPPGWPQLLREHMIARAQVCLHLRQAPAWPFASTMRLHHLLSQGAVVVAQRSAHGCLQERFVDLTEPTEVVAAALQACRPDGQASAPVALGKQRYMAYWEASRPARDEVRRMIRQAGDGHG